MALYLDIETTYQGDLTVIGFHSAQTGTVQLVVPDISVSALNAALPEAEAVYTYNGDRFDLAIIEKQVGVRLRDRYRSVDLMKAAHKAGLYGGLKAAEARLGIKRTDGEVDGKEAARLWYVWRRDNDQAALERLLAYNREDVENLVLLHERLAKYL